MKNMFALALLGLLAAGSLAGSAWADNGRHLGWNNPNNPHYSQDWSRHVDWDRDGDVDRNDIRIGEQRRHEWMRHNHNTAYNNAYNNQYYNRYGANNYDPYNSYGPYNSYDPYYNNNNNGVIGSVLGRILPAYGNGSGYNGNSLSQQRDIVNRLQAQVDYDRKHNIGGSQYQYDLQNLRAAQADYQRIANGY